MTSHEIGVLPAQFDVAYLDVIETRLRRADERRAAASRAVARARWLLLPVLGACAAVVALVLLGGARFGTLHAGEVILVDPGGDVALTLSAEDGDPLLTLQYEERIGAHASADPSGNAFAMASRGGGPGMNASTSPWTTTVTVTHALSDDIRGFIGLTAHVTPGITAYGTGTAWASASTDGTLDTDATVELIRLDGGTLSFSSLSPFHARADQANQVEIEIYDSPWLSVGGGSEAKARLDQGSLAVDATDVGSIRSYDSTLTLRDAKDGSSVHFSGDMAVHSPAPPP